MLYCVNYPKPKPHNIYANSIISTHFDPGEPLNFMDNLSASIAQEISDETLIQQFKDGDQEAFSALYHRHITNVYKRVRYIIPEAEVEDVTQEVFIAAMKSLGSFRGDSQFGTWLRTLTNHKVAEFYRKRSRKQEPQLAPLSDAFGKMEGSTSKMMEERIYIQKALSQLPENYREVIMLRFAEDLQFNEIADQMNQNIEATKSLFRRAIIALRNQLDE
jgi:RNA polymerase sigma-70 factor, ECF subfamily